MPGFFCRRRSRLARIWHCHDPAASKGSHWHEPDCITLVFLGGGSAMDRSDGTGTSSSGKPKIWRDIRARLCAVQSGPQWLPHGYRRNQRRMGRLLIAELLRDQRMTARRG
jgi:hypothetical protein